MELHVEDPPEYVVESHRQLPTNAIRWMVDESGLIPICVFFDLPNDVRAIAIEDIAELTSHEGMDLYKWPIAMAMVVHDDTGIARIDVDVFNSAFKYALRIFDCRLPPLDANMLDLSLVTAVQLAATWKR
jgi:hypothetical protein